MSQSNQEFDEKVLAPSECERCNSLAVIDENRNVLDEIMTAQEASIALGKNEKYIYSLWKNGSPILLEKSLALKGATLLITKEGYEHLIPLAKKKGRPRKKQE